MEDSIHDALGVDWSAQGGQSAEDLEVLFEEYALDYTGTGLVQDNPGTMSNANNLSGVAVPSRASSNWYGYWRIFRNPEDNPHESSEANGYSLSGEYGLGAMWIMTGIPPIPG